MYPNGVGNDGHTVDEDNNGWRCKDMTGSRGHFSLRNLPEGLIDSLGASDSATSYLRISSATLFKDQGSPHHFGNDIDVATADDGASSRSSNQEYTGPSKVVVESDAVVSLVRGGEAQDRIAEHNRRRLADKEGTNEVLVVRVSAPDDVPSKTAAQLSSDVFSDSANLVSE